MDAMLTDGGSETYETSNSEKTNTTILSIRNSKLRFAIITLEETYKVVTKTINHLIQNPVKILMTRIDQEQINERHSLKKKEKELQKVVKFLQDGLRTMREAMIEQSKAIEQLSESEEQYKSESSAAVTPRTEDQSQIKVGKNAIMTNGYEQKFEEVRNLQPVNNSVLLLPNVNNKFPSPGAHISLRIIKQEKQKKNTEATKEKWVIKRPNHNMNNKRENGQSIITSSVHRSAKVLSAVTNAKNGVTDNTFKIKNHDEPVLSSITNDKTVHMQKATVDNIRSKSSNRSKFQTVKAFSAGKTPNANRGLLYGIKSQSFRPKSLDERKLSPDTYGKTAQAKFLQRSKSSNYARNKTVDNGQCILPMIASKPLALITRKT